MQEDKPEIHYKSEPFDQTENPSDLQVYNQSPVYTEKLKKALKSEDVFNILKDMPHELNIINGDGG